MKLDLDNFSLGDTILYCPKCGWQSEEPNIAMANVCWECGTHGLNYVVVCDVLIKDKGQL